MKSFADKVPARAKAKLAWWLLCSRAGGAGFDPGSLRRIQDYLRVSLKVQEPAYTNPLQKPEHYFPGLAANPWYEPDEFEWTAALCDAHETIKSELAHIQSRLQRQPESISEGGRWTVFYLYYQGRKVEENCRHCPETVRAIDSLPNLNGVGHAYFSVLNPGTHILPHYGPINVWLRCHLGLSIPEGCRFRVGTETRSWQEGKCLIFDDAFDHEVWSHADDIRTVLVLDFWHPELTAAESWAMGQIIRLSAVLKKLER